MNKLKRFDFFDLNPIKKNHTTIYGVYFSLIFFTFIYCMGLKYFILTYTIFASGFTGIAQLLNFIIPFLDIGTLIIILNVPLLISAFIFLSKKIFFRTTFVIFMIGFILNILPPVQNVFVTGKPSDNQLLALLFGGLIMGYAIGKILENNASTGGTDIIGLLLLKKGIGTGVGRISLLINIAIFISGYIMEQKFEVVMYSILLVVVISLTVDRTQSQNNITMVTVISKKAGLGNIISLGLNRSSTRYDVIGGYSGRKMYAYQIVLNNKELVNLKQLIKEHDDEAFYVYQKVSKVQGNFSKRVV